jgi:hypothetical protein
VDKYGHEGLWHRLTRFESKQQVAAKFSGLQQELHDISQNVRTALPHVSVVCDMRVATRGVSYRRARTTS